MLGKIGEKMFENYNTSIPTRWIGPIQISGGIIEKQAHVPLATFENTFMAIHQPWR